MGAQGRRRHRAAAGREVEAADAHLRQPQPAGDRRLLRAVHVRLRPPAVGARDEGGADRAAAQPDHRQADGQDRLGPELGGDPGRRVLQALEGPQLRRHPEGHLRAVREHVHDVPAAAVRALPQSVVRRELPVGLDLQARGRRHRADRPGQVPRLAHVRVAAARTRRSTTTGRAARPRSASSAIRASRPDSRPCARRPASAASATWACCCTTPTASPRPRASSATATCTSAQLVDLPRSGRPEGHRAGARRRRSRQLARGGAQEPRLQDGGGLEGGAAAASGVPDAADGLVRAAAVADHRRRQRGAGRHQRRDSRRQAAAHPGQVPRQPADRRRHGARGARARAHARDARVPAREARRRARPTWPR